MKESIMGTKKGTGIRCSPGNATETEEMGNRINSHEVGSFCIRISTILAFRRRFIRIFNFNLDYMIVISGVPTQKF